MHRLIERQIHRHLGAGAEITPQMQSLFQVISDAYEQFDADRLMLERSLELNSQELMERNKALQAANSAKSAFLANMSHEIRTPVTAIIGYADLVLESQQSMSDRQDCLMVIQRNARHLVSLINDILDISKIEANRMTVENIQCDLSNLIFDVGSLMRLKAVDKGLELKCSSVGPIPRTIHSDGLRLKQILVNLVGNAIKFTERGTVSVRVACEPRTNGSRIRFEVQDNGIGMTPEQLGRLFQAFTQADESTTRRYGGTGLGLTISKRLANLLGGDITVVSAAGVGSTFIVTIEGGPLAGAEMLPQLEAAKMQEIAAKQDGPEMKLHGRILLAEDGVDNQRLITAYLRRMGAQITVVENGLQALERAKLEEFDIILMDMQMPEMDGYTATQELVKIGYRKPIIALTAHAMAEDRAKCLAAGCTEYLTKPIDKHALYHTLKMLLNGPAGPMTVAPKESPLATERIHSTYRDDPDMKDLICEYIDGLPKQIGQMMSLLDAQNMDGLRRVMHQFKGAGGGYGFPGITDRAAAAEAGIKIGESLEAIKAKVDSFLELVRSIEGYKPESEKTTG